MRQAHRIQAQHIRTDRQIAIGKRVVAQRFRQNTAGELHARHAGSSAHAAGYARPHNVAVGIIKRRELPTIRLCSPHLQLTRLERDLRHAPRNAIYQRLGAEPAQHGLHGKRGGGVTGPLLKAQLAGQGIDGADGHPFAAAGQRHQRRAVGNGCLRHARTGQGAGKQQAGVCQIHVRRHQGQHAHHLSRRQQQRRGRITGLGLGKLHRRASRVAAARRAGLNGAAGMGGAAAAYAAQSARTAFLAANHAAGERHTQSAHVGLKSAGLVVHRAHHRSSCGSSAAIRGGIQQQLTRAVVAQTCGVGCGRDGVVI